MAVNQISLNPSVIARILGAVAFLLILASIGGQFSKYMLGHDHLKGLVPLFYLDYEQNIPTYFSLLLILFAALLLAKISILNAKLGIPHTSKWAILSFGFLFMGYDEIFSVHEQLIMPVRTLLGGNNLGVFYFAWVIPGIALVLVVGLFFLRFLLQLHEITRFRLLVAATIYLGGAIGVELIGGRYAELHGYETWTYSMIVNIEESLEMAGLIVFIWTLLNYCADSYKEVRFQYDAHQRASPARYSDNVPQHYVNQ